MLPTENLNITVEFKYAIEIKINIALLIKTGFQIIADILSNNMTFDFYATLSQCNICNMFSQSSS